MDGFDLATLRVDRTKETEGVWMEMGDKCRLLIARWRNPKCKQRFKRLQKQTNASIRALDDEADERIVRECVAYHCLLGWEKLFIDGEEVEAYSPKVALDLFKKFPDFLAFVLGYAQEREAYRAEMIEETKGTSDGSSSGS